jgi:hypothetical protein
MIKQISTVDIVQDKEYPLRGLESIVHLNHERMFYFHEYFPLLKSVMKLVLIIESLLL